MRNSSYSVCEPAVGLATIPAGTRQHSHRLRARGPSASLATRRSGSRRTWYFRRLHDRDDRGIANFFKLSLLVRLYQGIVELLLHRQLPLVALPTEAELRHVEAGEVPLQETLQVVSAWRRSSRTSSSRRSMNCRSALPPVTGG